MKGEFVLGFLFNNDYSKVVLIKKNRPSWMSGKLNGVGGKVENYDNTIFDAMSREFFEETGVQTINLEWVHVLMLSFPDAYIHVFTTKSDSYFEKASTTTDEFIRKIHVDQLHFFDVMENLGEIINLSIQRMKII